MSVITEKKTFLRPVDLVKDREYILEELRKSENEPSIPLEQAYKESMEYLDNLQNLMK